MAQEEEDDPHPPALARPARPIGAVTIDRLGLSGSGDGARATWVYILAPAAITLPLQFPALRRARPWALIALALGGYAALKVAWPDTPEVGGFHIHMAAAEATLVALAALLAHRLAAGLDGLDQALATVGFGDYPALPLEGPQATNEILAEMARSTGQAVVRLSR
jgi:hypothetical protein